MCAGKHAQHMGACQTVACGEMPGCPCTVARRLTPTPIPNCCLSRARHGSSSSWTSRGSRGSPGRRRCAGSGGRTRCPPATRYGRHRRGMRTGYASHCLQQQPAGDAQWQCPASRWAPIRLTWAQHPPIHPPTRCPPHLRNCWLLEVLAWTRFASRSRCRPAGQAEAGHREGGWVDRFRGQLTQGGSSKGSHACPPCCPPRRRHAPHPGVAMTHAT